jgi:drug/metabolite transporter (DMT)-like permease
MAAASVLISATQPVVFRYGAARLDPLLYCAGASLFAGAAAVAMLSMRGELAPLMDRRYVKRLFTLSVFGTMLTGMTLAFGLRYIQADAAVLLLQAEPIYSLILATIFAGERPQAGQVAATITIVFGIGVVLTAQHRLFSPLWAAALILVTPMFWQLGHLISLTIMPPLSPICISGARYFYGGVVLPIILLVLDRGAISSITSWSLPVAVMAGTGVIIYLGGAAAWYGAINRLPLSWTTAIVVPSVPLLSVIFAMLFLGERATMLELGGC